MRNFASVWTYGHRADLLVVVALVASLSSGQASAQKPELSLPVITRNDTTGKPVPVAVSELCDFEIAMRNRFARSDAPDEVFALALGDASIFFPEDRAPVAVVEVSIYNGTEGELRYYGRDDDPSVRYYRRPLSEKEVSDIRAFTADNNVDQYAQFQNSTIGGSKYVYVHLNAKDGKRIMISNPPSNDKDAPMGDPSWRYSRLVDFFFDLRKIDTLEAQYVLPRPINGFEVVYAHPAKEIAAVWAHRDRLHVTIRNKWSNDPPKHRSIVDGKLGEEVADPKRLGKRSVSISNGDLLSPRFSSDGRYVVGMRRSDGHIALYDRRANKRLSIMRGDSDAHSLYIPLYYLDAQNVFLLGGVSPARVERFWNDTAHCELRNVMTLYVLDPTDRAIVPIDTFMRTNVSELSRFWFQKLPRRLQAVHHRPDVVWVAQRDFNSKNTKVGHFDTRKFEFDWHSSVTVPFAGISTKDICVDEAGRKIYCTCLPPPGLAGGAGRRAGVNCTARGLARADVICR